MDTFFRPIGYFKPAFVCKLQLCANFVLAKTWGKKSCPYKKGVLIFREGFHCIKLTENGVGPLSDGHWFRVDKKGH